MLRIVSKASSVESFMQLFRRFCDRESVFIATRTPKPVGARPRFSISLSTGAPMIAGHGEVTEAYDDRQNPYGRPGMRLRFLELDEASRLNVERLMATPAPQGGSPPPLPGLPSTSAQDGQEPGAAVDPAFATLPTEPHQALSGPSSAQSAGQQDEATQAEDRTRGSQFILPANPFGELSNESLEAFVECAMYEDMGSDDGSDAAQASQQAPEQYRAVTWWPPTGQSSALPPGSVLGSTGQVSSVLAPRPSPPQQHGFEERLTAKPTAKSTAKSTARPTARPRTRPPAKTPATPVANQASQPTGKSAVATSSTPGKVMHTAMIAHPKRSKTSRIIIAAAILCTFLGLGVGYLLWGGARQKTTTVAASQEASASASPAASAAGNPAPAPARGSDAGSEAQGSDTGDDSDHAPAPDAEGARGDQEDADSETDQEDADAEDACEVVVVSRPDEAHVFVGDRHLGETPLKATLPCGKTEFVFKRARYDEETEVANLEPGKQTRVRMRMHRPRIKLEVLSKPRGATVIVDRRRVGKTPLEVEIRAFSRTVVVVRKSGYKRYRKRIYPKPPREKLRVRLRRR